ncbi:Flagellar FliL protein [Jannaschia seosinensis]|uniref:Flagellar protein FliL n=1 Tax=Jannaschia seosinensis TaxID=313367 RepID=A0A0M7BFH9_9RHOB|nr:flagellar basal body-associated FliL family protein [Jannaschia seosinensis]CUH40663.1 Flagellar FliL protein [Jannaschia seosinensis]
MAEPEAEQEETGQDEPKKGKKLWLLLTLALACAFGGGGFYAMRSGMLDSILPSGHTAEAPVPNAHVAKSDPPTFLELDPLMISVGDASGIKQLRFRAFLQTETADPKIAALQPRILDIFATYLRAIPVAELENPTALLRLRAQLLRRVQLLTGPDTVNDILIIDFVIT